MTAPGPVVAPIAGEDGMVPHAGQCAVAIVIAHGQPVQAAVGLEMAVCAGQDAAELLQSLLLARHRQHLSLLWTRIAPQPGTL